MDAFAWSPNFATGLDDIDSQHQHLFSGVRHLEQMLAQHPAVTGRELQAIFDDLTDYATRHFHEEEALMHRHGIAKAHVDQQRNQHGYFLREIARRRSILDEMAPEPIRKLLRFLTHWLTFHILGTDQSLARQIKAVMQGESAEEAYRMEQEALAASTAPLLKAMYGLFLLTTEHAAELQAVNDSLELRVTERTTALARANSALADLVHQLEAQMASSVRLSAELARTNEDLKRLAQTDALTGLPNRRHAMGLLGRLWTDSGAPDRDLACLLIDADGFKQVNDQEGHAAGDEVLRAFAQQLNDSVRTDDTVCRLGGDEFIVICPDTSLPGALKLAEDIRHNVSAMRTPAGNSIWKGSASIGVAARQPDQTRFDDLIKAADEGLYRAKREGRNRVAVAGGATFPHQSAS